MDNVLVPNQVRVKIHSQPAPNRDIQHVLMQSQAGAQLMLVGGITTMQHATLEIAKVIVLHPELQDADAALIARKAAVLATECLNAANALDPFLKLEARAHDP